MYAFSKLLSISLKTMAGTNSASYDNLLYVLITACLLSIRFDITFATYYTRKQKTQSNHYTCSKEINQSHLCIGDAGCRL